MRQNEAVRQRCEQYKKRLELLKNDRAVFNAHWEAVNEVVRPDAASFLATTNQQGQRKNQALFDSIGQYANQLLAAGFYSMLTNPTQKWFSVTTNNPLLQDSRAVQTWLYEVSNIMFEEIQRPHTGFATALHELYLDYGAYGNGTLFVTMDRTMSHLNFLSLPLQETYFVEGPEGRIVALYRAYQKTVQQVVDEFGLDNQDDQVIEAVRAGRFTDKLEILHVIEPRRYVQGPIFDSRQLPYASIYIDITHQHLLRESGYEEMPFMSARFFKNSYEIYGRGPGMTALPDLRTLQELIKTLLKMIKKQVDPPLLVPDNAFINGLRLAPGSISYYRATEYPADAIKPFQVDSDPRWVLDVAERIRERVKDMFFLSQLQLNDGPQMTATEVLQRTEEKARLLGPAVGRAQSELLGPALERVFGLLLRSGAFPEVPPEMLDLGPQLKVIYLSQFAKVMEQNEANSLLRVTQLITPFVSVAPDTLDVFDAERIARGLGEMYALNPAFFRSQEEVQAMRQQRQEQQQQQMQMEQIVQGSQAVSNMASGMATLGGM